MGCSSSTQSEGLKATPSDDYKVIKELGVGASCCVKEVTHVKTGETLAMKTVSKKDRGNKELWETEVKLLEVVNNPSHPNVLGLKGYFEDSKYYYITTPLCSGGELFDRVVKGDYMFSEKKAGMITKMMLEGLLHCHKRGVVHRDLKPENFVFENDREDSPMRLIDFGCARQVTDTTPFDASDACGSDYYIAPEVLLHQALTGKIWKKSDAWSVGVILFMLVSGNPPFWAEEVDDIYRAIIATRPVNLKSLPKNVSEGCKSLIGALLNKNHRKRTSVGEALQHPWLQDLESVSDSPMPTSIKESLANFQENCKLKKAVGKLFSDMMTEDDKKIVHDVFKKFDKNNDGRLDKEEICDMMKHINKGAVDAQNLMNNFDDDGNDGVDLEEFQQLYGLTHADKDTAKLQKIFDQFDSSGDGKISATELKKMLDITIEEAAGIIAENDSSADQLIDFDEWVAAMKNVKK